MLHLTFGQKLLLLVAGPAVLAVMAALSEDVVIVEALKESRIAKERRQFEEVDYLDF
jgi:hypothetical protein